MFYIVLGPRRLQTGLHSAKPAQDMMHPDNSVDVYAADAWSAKERGIGGSKRVTPQYNIECAFEAIAEAIEIGVLHISRRHILAKTLKNCIGKV